MNGTPILLIGGKKESGKSTVAKVAEEQLGAVVISFAAPMKRFAAALGMPFDNLWGSTAKRDEAIETPEFFKEMPNTSHWDCWEHSKQFAEAFNEHLAPVFGGVGVPGSMGIVAGWCWSEWRWVNGSTDSPAHPFTCRHALQTLGTECGRSINPDCWGNYGMETAFKVLTGEFSYTQPGGLVKTEQGKYMLPKMAAIDDCRFPNELLIGARVGAKSIYVDRPSTAGKAGDHASETSLDLIPQYWWGTLLRNDRDLPTLTRLAKHKLNALGFSNGLENYD
ncbi:MAG: hypothetical protein EPN91_08210 [Salinibacterium sp.]|nr:MAG: hypothetical protein EPN91_08210 [Salinibacterium sp.]